MHEIDEKFKKINQIVCGNPTLLTITKGGLLSWWTTHD
jgi:hypothetical protein